jgi:hypothetical protein
VSFPTFYFLFIPYESAGTVCVLVADCPWPQSRARLKPETMGVTFEEFSPTYDFFDHTSSGILDTLKPYSTKSLLYAFLCRKIRLRWLLYLGIAGSAMGSLTYLFYRSGSAAAIIESQNGMISAFVTLALMDLAARATPRGSEALGFAIMMSILNVAQSLSDVFGSWLIDHLHFTFFRLVWLNAATTALVLVLIPLVPRLLLDRTDTTPA